MSEETTHLVERLRLRLHRSVRRLTLGDLAFGSVVTLGVLATLWLVSAAAEAGLWMAPGPRTAVAATFAVAGLALFGVFLARPLGQLLGLGGPPSDEEAARRIGSVFPDRIADRFVNLIQLSEGAGTSRGGALADRAVARLGHEVEAVEFEAVEDFSRARRAARWLAVPVAGVLVFLLAAPGAFLGASGRLLSPTDHFQRPAPFRLALSAPGSDLVRGDSLMVTAHARPVAEGNTLPPRVTLQVQDEGEERVEDLTLAPADSNRQCFRHVFAGVERSFRYRAVAEAGGRPLRTGWKEVRVAERPRVANLRVTLAPPAYSGLPQRALPSGTGDVTALPGTEVTVEATLAGPRTEQAFLRFAPGGGVDTLAVEDGTASGAFTLDGDGSYRVALQSAAGAPNADPIRYRLQTTSDAAPTVAFRAPAPEAELTDALRPQLRWQMSDDFGFAQQKLYYRLAERRRGAPMDGFAAVEVPTGRPGLRDQEVTHDWLLRETTDLDLAPGDVLEYYVRVWDNNRVAGYQSARTQTQRLRLPSLSEKYEKLDRTQQGAEEQMQRLQEESTETRRQFERLREEVRRKREGDWEDQRQAEQLRERQQQMQQRAQELQQQIEEAARQMQQGELTSPETQRQYEQLQEVAQQMQSPELQEALQKLQEAMQEMDMEKMQQAMQDFEFNEEQYRERLERTRELFENIKAQQEMEEVAKRAGELAEEERRLSEETQKLSESEAEGQNEQQGEAESTGEKKAADEQRDGEAGQENAEQEEPQQQDAQQKEARRPGAEKREELARQQEEAREEMQKLREKMQKLAKDMEGMRGAPEKEMQQMQEGAKQMPQQMQQNSQQLRQNELQDAQQGQQSMQQQLQQMQQQMQQMQAGMQQKKQQVNMAGVRQALANTLRLSKEQEALRQRTGGLSAGSPALRAVTRRQNKLAEGLRATRDSLTVLSRDIPKMTRAVQEKSDEALREMQAVTEAMTARTARPASGHQKAAMKGLNELALLLSRLLEQMQQSQSGQGSGMSAQQMSQQLQQMAGQQQQINGQMQQMLNQMQGDRLSQGQSKRLQQMAQQQKAVQKQLQELREQGAEGQALGDLQKVAEQMGEAIDEMQRQRLNRETLQRQRQILSRLLQARQSLQKRGKKEQRRSREATDEDHTRSRPATGAPEAEEDAQRLRRSLIRSLESGYAPDYEQLIKRYFELLQQEEENAAPAGSQP